MKKLLIAFTLLSGVATSGCVAALLGAGAGATVLACTEEELNCPVD